MAKEKNSKPHVIEINSNGIKAEIIVRKIGGKDYLSLTDMVKNLEGKEDSIKNWMRTKDVVELLGHWELKYNPDFNVDAWKELRNQAGSNIFTLTPDKWVKATNAIGIFSKSGRYGGGTFAEETLALAFCAWTTPAMQLYVYEEFQRMKAEEMLRLYGEKDWSVKRLFSKINYIIHNDAVREYLIPPRIIQNKQEGIIYATEADLLNVALFGISAKDWKLQNPDLKGNMRDYASAEQLVVLANLENLNAEYIRLGLPKEERLLRLNEIAIHQMQLMLQAPAIKKALNEGDKE